MSSDDEFERFLDGDSDDENTAFSKATAKKTGKGLALMVIGVQPAYCSQATPRAPVGQVPRATMCKGFQLNSADPYDFEMRDADGSSDEEAKKEERSRRKREERQRGKADQQPASRKLSLEERMADILKRHGSSLASTLAPPPEDAPIPPPVEVDVAESQEAPPQEQPSSDESSDSLGMESADFEVIKAIGQAQLMDQLGRWPLAATKVSRSNEHPANALSRESLDEPFTVHLPVEDAPVDRFRYTPTEGSLVGEEPKADVPFESTFAKMKSVFSLEASEAASAGADDSSANDKQPTEAEACDEYGDDFDDDTPAVRLLKPPLLPPLQSPGPPPPPELTLDEEPSHAKASYGTGAESSASAVVAVAASFASILAEPEVPAYNLKAVTVDTVVSPPSPETPPKYNLKAVTVETVVSPPSPATPPKYNLKAVAVETVVGPASTAPTTTLAATPVPTGTSMAPPPMADAPPPVATAVPLPAAERFRQLQAQLTEARTVHDERVADAFERDKILIRAFSTKEHELKLELQAAQREILALRHEVHALSTEQDVHTLADARQLGKYVQSQQRVGVAMTTAAYETMRKEMETQEGLIQGYQLENERLMQQLKEVRRDLQYDVHTKNEALTATIKELRQQLQHQPATGRPPLETQLATDARVLALQDELREALDARHTRERELKVELDMAKKAKRDLECQIAGVRMDHLQRENEAFEKLRAESLAAQRQADAKIAQLQAKLDWYIQNQRFLDEQDELVRQQRATIDELQRAARATPSQPSRAADKRRIQALEAQLAEMERAMQKRHPDSLVNLILASKPTADDHVAEVRREAQVEVQRLQDELRDAQHSAELKLAAFRQQHERIVQQLQARLDAKQEAPDASRTALLAKIKVPSGRAVGLSRIVQELERKLEAKSRRAAPSPPTADDGATVVQPLLHVGRVTVMGRLRKELGDVKVELADVREQLRASEDARQALVQTMALAPPPAPAPPSGVPQSQHDVVLQQIAQLQKEAADRDERHASELRRAKDVLQDEVLRLTHDLAAAHNDVQRALSVAARVPHLEAQVLELQRQTQIPNTPSMLQYHALELQVQALLQKYSVREAELQTLLHQASESNQLEAARLRSHYEGLLSLKNADIARFQLQVPSPDPMLDEMLRELQALQATEI
ncbi:hypothetical protein ACHHYP_09970 [Achlya hypogyna]|uniref:Centrosomal protein of 162 kDa n=1 Tax=Achlya hypogyna TaxID=1202772 RepID=A0A1V9YM49_ACHHY|nr:hypothetical protein ACHHYP_09970 [Achlya hypogyna]